MSLIGTHAQSTPEAEAAALRTEVLRYCQRTNADSEVVMLAAADLVALTAAALDERGGLPESLQDRLHTFCQRVEHTYARYRNRRRGG